MKYTAFSALLVMIIFTSGCRKDEADIIGQVVFDTRLEGESIALGDTVTLENGYEIRIDRLDFYVGEVGFSGSGGGTTNNSQRLIRFIDGETSFEFDILDDISYNKLQFGIGVREEWNSDPDPSQYDIGHPLSDFSGMFWSWNSGYKFIQLEGKANVSGVPGAELEQAISIHTGLNEFYRTVSFDRTREPESDKVTYSVHINVEDWFSSVHEIDIALDAETHTTDDMELAEKFSDNFAASLSVD